MIIFITVLSYGFVQYAVFAIGVRQAARVVSGTCKRYIDGRWITTEQ